MCVCVCVREREGTCVSVSPCCQCDLVHPLAAVKGSTVTGDLVLIVLQVKLVVIGQLDREKDREKERKR